MLRFVSKKSFTRQLQKFWKVIYEFTTGCSFLFLILCRWMEWQVTLRWSLHPLNVHWHGPCPPQLCSHDPTSRVATTPLTTMTLSAISQPVLHCTSSPMSPGRPHSRILISRSLYTVHKLFREVRCQCAGGYGPRMCRIYVVQSVFTNNSVQCVCVCV